MHAELAHDGIADVADLFQRRGAGGEVLLKHDAGGMHRVALRAVFFRLHARIRAVLEDQVLKVRAGFQLRVDLVHRVLHAVQDRLLRRFHHFGGHGFFRLGSGFRFRSGFRVCCFNRFGGDFFLGLVLLFQLRGQLLPLVQQFLFHLQQDVGDAPVAFREILEIISVVLAVELVGLHQFIAHLLGGLFLPFFRLDHLVQEGFILRHDGFEVILHFLVGHFDSFLGEFLSAVVDRVQAGIHHGLFHVALFGISVVFQDIRQRVGLRRRLFLIGGIGAHAVLALHEVRHNALPARAGFFPAGIQFLFRNAVTHLVQLLGHGHIANRVIHRVLLDHHGIFFRVLAGLVGQVILPYPVLLAAFPQLLAIHGDQYGIFSAAFRQRGRGNEHHQGRQYGDYPFHHLCFLRFSTGKAQPS